MIISFVIRAMVRLIFLIASSVEGCGRIAMCSPKTIS